MLPLDAYPETELDEHITGVIYVSYYSLKKGVELFQNKAGHASTKEQKSIHDMGTYRPHDAKKSTKKQKQDALGLLLFVTEKEDRRTKSQTYAR